jgi:hypothetical protein
VTTCDFGRATEARFTLDAFLHGLLVSRPEADNPGYDRIVDNGKRLFRVQVKGATRNPYGNKNYVVNINRAGRKLPNFDEVAVWLDGESRWVFLPSRVRRLMQVQIAPSGKHTRRGWEVLTRR